MKLNVRNTNGRCMPFFFAMETSLLNIKNHVISKRKKLVILDLNALCVLNFPHSDCYCFGLLVGNHILRSSKCDPIL